MRGRGESAGSVINVSGRLAAPVSQIDTAIFAGGVAERGGVGLSCGVGERHTDGLTPGGCRKIVKAQLVEVADDRRYGDARPSGCRIAEDSTDARRRDCQMRQC